MRPSARMSNKINGCLNVELKNRSAPRALFRPGIEDRQIVGSAYVAFRSRLYRNKARTRGNKIAITTAILSGC
jgi:hypothetical protein